MYPCLYGGGGGPAPTLITKSITENGTYNAQDDNADGYSQVSVNVAGGAGDLLQLLQNNSLGNEVNLTDAVLKTNATKIRKYTFYQAYVLRINLQNIQSIGAYAFYAGGTPGGGIIIPNCTSIEEYAFKDYSRSFDAITSIDFSNLETVGAYAFQRAKLKCKLVLPKCKSIANNAFQETQCGAYGLEAPLLETIGNQAFNSTYFNTDIELPSIKTIGNNAFQHTSSVNFTIGPNCTSIGNTIFASYGVTNLYVLATTPPTLSSNFKSGNTGAQHIYVPAESVSAYQTANVWSNYASIIEAIPT